MGQYALEEIPLKGKLFNDDSAGGTGGPYRGGKSSPKKIGQPTKSGYLSSRMAQDDSDYVNMSDQQLKGFIRQTGSKK